MARLATAHRGTRWSVGAVSQFASGWPDYFDMRRGLGGSAVFEHPPEVGLSSGDQAVVAQWHRQPSSPGDFYWNGAYGTHWWADPQEQLAVVFMAQTPGLQRRRFRQIVNALVYQAITD